MLPEQEYVGEEKEVINIEKSGGYYNYLHENTREEQIEYLQNKMAAYQLYDTGLTVIYVTFSSLEWSVNKLFKRLFGIGVWYHKVKDW